MLIPAAYADLFLELSLPPLLIPPAPADLPLLLIPRAPADLPLLLIPPAPADVPFLLISPALADLPLLLISPASADPSRSRCPFPPPLLVILKAPRRIACGWTCGTRSSWTSTSRPSWSMERYEEVRGAVVGWGGAWAAPGFTKSGQLAESWDYQEAVGIGHRLNLHARWFIAVHPLFLQRCLAAFAQQPTLHFCICCLACLLRCV